MTHPDGTEVFVATVSQREARRPRTLVEAALELGLEPSTLRRQIGRGRLRARKVGPLWTVTPAELERYRAEVLGRVGRPANPAR